MSQLSKQDVCLLKAVLAVDLAEVTKALSAGGNAALEHEGYTLPLYAVLPSAGGGKATDADRARVMQQLILCGADAEQPDLDGFMPIHQAAILGFIEVVRVLLEANPDTVNAIAYGLCDRSWRRTTPLHSAAKSGNVELCELLLENGANPLAKQPDGCLPWHWAEEGSAAEKLLASAANRCRSSRKRSTTQRTAITRQPS